MFKRLDRFLVGLFQPLVTKTLDAGRNIAKFFLCVSIFMCLMSLAHFLATELINYHSGDYSWLSIACESFGFSFFFIFMVWYFVGNFQNLVKNISKSEYGRPVLCQKMRKESLSGVILRIYGVLVLLTIIPPIVFKIIIDLGKLHDMWSYAALINDVSFMLEHIAFIIIVFASGCRYSKPFNEEEFQKAYS